MLVVEPGLEPESWMRARPGVFFLISNSITAPSPAELYSEVTHGLGSHS